MSSANHFGKSKRSIKRQMAIARKSRSVRRNIEDNDMIEDRLSDRSSDTDSDATIIIDTDPIPSNQVMNHLSALMMLLYLVQK